MTVPGSANLLATTAFGGGEPVFIVLTDPDQDRDPFAVSHLGWGMNPQALWYEIGRAHV